MEKIDDMKEEVKMCENTEMNKSKYKLEAGRPESCEGRLEKEVRVYDFLDELGLEYYRTDHPDAEAYTMEACREIDAVLGATVCKNLVLTNRQHTDYYLLLMPGDDCVKIGLNRKSLIESRFSRRSPISLTGKGATSFARRVS